MIDPKTATEKMDLGMIAKPAIDFSKVAQELDDLDGTLSEYLEASLGYLKSFRIKVMASLLNSPVKIVNVNDQEEVIEMGELSVSDEVKSLLSLDADAIRKHFKKLRDDAAKVYATACQDRTARMDQVGGMVARHAKVLKGLDEERVDLDDTVKARIMKNYQILVKVDEAIGSLQKHLCNTAIKNADLTENQVGTMIGNSKTDGRNTY